MAGFVTKISIFEFGSGDTPNGNGRTKSFTFVDVAGKLVSNTYETRRGRGGAA